MEDRHRRDVLRVAPLGVRLVAVRRKDLLASMFPIQEMEPAAGDLRSIRIARQKLGSQARGSVASDP